METQQTLSEQKSYWLRQLQKGNISQERYDRILDYLESWMQKDSPDS